MLLLHSQDPTGSCWMSWDESPGLLAPSSVLLVESEWLQTQAVEPARQSKNPTVGKGLGFLACEMGTMLFPIFQGCSEASLS